MKRSHAALVMTTGLVFAGSALAQTLDKVINVGSLGDQSGISVSVLNGLVAARV
jgi:branched-chain amino acid transport system substrate-binding protein